MGLAKPGKDWDLFFSRLQTTHRITHMTTIYPAHGSQKMKVFFIGDSFALIHESFILIGVSLIA